MRLKELREAHPLTGEPTPLSPATCGSAIKLRVWENGAGLELQDCSTEISWYFGTSTKEDLYVSLRKLSRAKRIIDALYETLEDEIRALPKGK